MKLTQNADHTQQKPREYWINISPHGIQGAFQSKAVADVSAGNAGRAECIHVREVRSRTPKRVRKERVA